MLEQASTSNVAPFTVTKGSEIFTIREARRDELDIIGWTAAEAFIDDAMAHYYSGTTKPLSVEDKTDMRTLYDLYRCVYKACMLGGGRAIVAVPKRSSASASTTTIAAAVCWYPPRQRITVVNALRSGMLRCIMNWGFGGFKRMSKEYSVVTHGVFQQAFNSKAMEIQATESWKQRMYKRKSKLILQESDSWYLQLMFSSKSYEGRGLMSTLIREGHAYIQSVTPGIPITLDASSSRSRDRYLHLGYELMENQTIIGAGKATSTGIAPSKNNPVPSTELTGVPYWCMVNWKPVISGEDKPRNPDS
ncbi:hypothetical protein F5880DRAFT_1578889 [Lentinula raphanica]|nr:hypothetical protein F5880DRAFT_1578889 [Lentinula raphanica]